MLRMIEAGPGAPKYLRLADDLRRRIKDGEYAAGDRLPTEAALVQRYSVSPPTVRQALGVLRSEGIIETRHGIGTFVRTSKRLRRRARHRYGPERSDDANALTGDLTIEIVAAGPAEPPMHVREHLEGDVIVRRHQVRDETGRIVELGASYLPASFAAGTYLEERTVVPRALFRCVEEVSGLRYAQAEDFWTARTATQIEVDTLGLAIGTAVLHVLHVAKAGDGAVLEVSESTWPADAMMIVDSYPIDGD